MADVIGHLGDIEPVKEDDPIITELRSLPNDPDLPILVRELVEIALREYDKGLGDSPSPQ